MAVVLRLIVNPTAGGGRAAGALDAVSEILREGASELEVCRSISGEHVTALTREAAARGDAAVVVCGGDGTANAALQGLIGGATALGLVRLGSGNDFARGLGLPTDPIAAARVILAGKRRRIDAGQVIARESGGCRYFNCVAGVGLDADAIRHIQAAPWLRGPLKYTYGGLRALLGYRPRQVSVEADGLILERKVVFVAATNTPTYGGGMRVCPDAQMDDGLLDVCLVEGMPVLKLLAVFPTVYGGYHTRLREVHMQRTVRLTLEAEPPLTVCVDGEITDLSTPVEIECIPAALSVFTP